MPSCAVNSFSYTIRPGDSLWLLAQRFHTTVQAIRSMNPLIHEDKLSIGQIICIPQEYELNPMSEPQCPHQIDMKEQMLANHLRMLWEQHVYWTRMVILGIAFGLPDTKVTTERLLRNPDDFEKVLKLFYGEKLAVQFADLFTTHLITASEMVKAAGAGNIAAAGAAEKRWYANADQIAAFFAGINPYWSEQEWRKMMYEHLDMTKMQAVQILTQKYGDSISTFDQIERDALLMADMMTQGIMEQFPRCFR